MTHAGIAGQNWRAGQDEAIGPNLKANQGIQCSNLRAKAKTRDHALRTHPVGNSLLALKYLRCRHGATSNLFDFLTKL